MSRLTDVEKPLAFLIVLFLGRMLRLKKQTVLHVLGVQQVIINCLLPALLYKGLVNMPAGDVGLAWQYALISFVYCFYLAFGFALLHRFLRFATDCTEFNTLMFMFTSLAPGLSALPYVEAVVETTPPGDIDAGKVALADLGIKPFVLFVLYMAASAISASTAKLNRLSSAKGTTSTNGSCIMNFSAIRSLIISYFTEPCSAASLLAMALLIFGPVPLSDQWIWGQAIARLAASCSPAIFLLIGIKLQRPQHQHVGLLALMVYRSGLAFVFVAVLSMLRSMRANEVMFWIFMCNSAASFLANMHVVRVSGQEDQAAYLSFHKLLDANRDGAQSEAIDSLLHQLDEAVVNLGEAMELAHVIFSQDTPRLNDTREAAECEEDHATALQELEQLRNSMKSFAPLLSLALITVSFAWTIALSVVISLVPVEVWEIRAVLPGVGIALVLIGAASLKVVSEQVAKRPAVDQCPQGGMATTSRPVESVRRGSIFDEANPDELTMLEAVEVMRQRASFLPEGEQQEIEDICDWALRGSITYCRQRGCLQSSMSLTASMIMSGGRGSEELAEHSHHRWSRASLQPSRSRKSSIYSVSTVGVEVDDANQPVSGIIDCALDSKTKHDSTHLKGLQDGHVGTIQKLHDIPDSPLHPTLLQQPVPSMKVFFLTEDEGTHNHKDCPSPDISAPASPSQWSCMCLPFDGCTSLDATSQFGLPKENAEENQLIKHNS